MVCLALAATVALAQEPRRFPGHALRGELVVTQPPEVRLNGRADRLAPGARIHGRDGFRALSGTLVGERLAVHYTRDLSGQLFDIWVLTPQELARKPWPTTADEAQRWTFDASTQTWSRR